jgi:hypothetical protein
MRAERNRRRQVTQSYRNLIANGIVLQLAMLDVYFTLKADAGGGARWKFVLYALFFAVIHFPSRD